jgi:hypothetical protein
VVYGRQLADRTLQFEPSGGLWNASLVMRDRETDSWWSIMTSSAIGGPLEKTRLVELPVGEKTTWKAWRSRHPDTLVLSVERVEHVENNPYDRYFSDPKTFRDLEIADLRLAPKTPIFAFQWRQQAFAVPHEKFFGGALLKLPGLKGQKLLLYRPAGASIFASTRAFLVANFLMDKNLARKSKAAAVESLVPPADGELPAGYEAVTGFDTFWYTWAAVHPGTEILD